MCVCCGRACEGPRVFGRLQKTPNRKVSSQPENPVEMPFSAPSVPGFCPSPEFCRLLSIMCPDLANISAAAAASHRMAARDVYGARIRYWCTGVIVSSQKGNDPPNAAAFSHTRARRCLIAAHARRKTGGGMNTTASVPEETWKSLDSRGPKSKIESQGRSGREK